MFRDPLYQIGSDLTEGEKTLNQIA